MPEFALIWVSEVAVNPVVVQKVTWVILSLTPASLCTCQFSEATSFLQDKISSPSSELTWPIVPVCEEETGTDPRKSTGAEGQDICGFVASQNLGRGGLLSLLSRHSGKGQAPSSQSCDRGGRGLAGGGMLDVTGCRWALRRELAAPGGLLAGWTTPSLPSGKRRCQSCVDFHQGPRESSGEGVS